MMQLLSRLFGRKRMDAAKSSACAAKVPMFEALEDRSLFSVGVPTAPTSLTAAVSSSTAVKLTWKDNSTVETGYKIERSTDDKTFTQINTAAKNSTTYTSGGLTTGKKYYYRVRAYDAVGNSGYTSVASATPTATSTTTTPKAPDAVKIAKPAVLDSSDWKGVGVDTDQDPSKLIPVLKSLGVKSVRLWFGVASWKGTYGQKAINEAGEYKAAGFKTMICVDAPEVPSQATITAFFNHLASMPGALTNVDLWEIGNEPDRPPFWKGTASQYVNIILKTAWNILHPLGAKIVGAAPSWDPNYGQQMVNAGYLNYVDYANFHAYGNSAKDIISRAAQYQKVYAGKPILISEWNVHTITDPTKWVTALNQIEAAIKNDAMSIFYYCLIKNTSSVGNSGIITSSLAPNGSFYSMFKSW
jgi:Fibronectin type III domain